MAAVERKGNRRVSLYPLDPAIAFRKLLTTPLPPRKKARKKSKPKSRKGL